MPGPDQVAVAALARACGEDAFQFLGQLVRQYGDIVRYPTSYGDVYLFNHPQQVHEILHRENYTRTGLIKLVLGEGLLSSDGPYWREQRRQAQPHFQPDRIAAFGPLIGEEIALFTSQWRGRAERGEAFDVSREMARLTLRIVVRALFSTDLDRENDELCDAITFLIRDLGSISRTLFGSSMQVNHNRNQHFDEAIKVVDRIVYKIIDDRQSLASQPDDLLTRFLRGHDPQTGKSLDRRQLRDEVVTILISGHETTALILSWAWVLLSQNPAARDRLQDEVDRVLKGTMPRVQDLERLPYTRMVLQESMRLYPPVWFIFRKAIRDDVVGGYQIPGGAPVLVSPYLVHRHEAIWSQPEAFDPLRFAPEQAAARPRYAYFPFGGGRHTCLGERFALMEGIMILAAVAQRFDVNLVPDHPVEPEPALTLRQRHGVQVALLERAMTGADDGDKGP